MQGDKDYPGATPSYIIWNLLSRYTKKNDLVVDPMAGSGTTMDVAREMKRRVLGYDINPCRKDIFRADARRLPLENGKADFVFVDPPYSTHINYSGSPDCIGKLNAVSPAYFKAMEQAMQEIYRILRDNRFMALYVCDSFKKGEPFIPIGMRLFQFLGSYFEPVDIITVVRRNAKLKRNHWHTAAIEGNYYLRGFNYLFIMAKGKPKDRRDPRETAMHLEMRKVKKNNAR
jgi:DNA modification methylase